MLKLKTKIMEYTIELEDNDVYTVGSHAQVMITHKKKDKGANVFVNYEFDFFKKNVESIKDIEIDYLNNATWLEIMHFVTSDEALTKIEELINNDLNK